MIFGIIVVHGVYVLSEPYEVELELYTRGSSSVRSEIFSTKFDNIKFALEIEPYS